MSTKKRQLIPILTAAVVKLSSMSAKFAELEYNDNKTMSKELKREFQEFKHGEMKVLEDTVFELRREMLHKPKRIDARQNAFKNLKRGKLSDASPPAENKHNEVDF